MSSPQAEHRYKDRPSSRDTLTLFFDPVESKGLLHRCIVSSTILYLVERVPPSNEPAPTGIPTTAEVVDALACDEALGQRAVKPGPDTEYRGTCHS